MSNNIEQGRRQIIKKGATAAVLATLGVFTLKPHETRAYETPRTKDVPETVLPILTEEGVTTYTLNLKPGDMFFVRTQKMDLQAQEAGQDKYLRFDRGASTNPGYAKNEGMIGIVANTDVTGLKVRTYDGAVLIKRGVTTATAYDERKAELDAMAKDFANQSFLAGECGQPGGCNEVVLFTAVAHQNNGIVEFDRSLYESRKGDGSASWTPEPILISKNDEAVQLSEWPADAKRAAKVFGGNTQQWSKNPDGSYSYKPVNGASTTIDPGSYVLDGWFEANGMGYSIVSKGVIVPVRGGTIFQITTPAQANELYKAKQRNEQGKLVLPIGFELR